MLRKLGRVKNAPGHEEGARVPPGQFLTRKFPVLTHGATPKIELGQWRLGLSGLVEEEVELDWKAFRALPWITVEADFHCVTQWSALDNLWEGVPFSELAAMARPRAEAKFIMAHCYGGYTTNLPLEVALESGGILAHKHNGQELSWDHGWPVRLIIPSRYGWKSAKWVNDIEFLEKDSPGFWEMRGYHNGGDPWKEERFWPELS
jgi:DMSO/TMAO reductase YedYZ molybdopterin-dependent catalytic subunit